MNSGYPCEFLVGVMRSKGIQEGISRNNFEVRMRAELKRPLAHGEDLFEDVHVQFSLNTRSQAFASSKQSINISCTQAEAHPQDEYRHPR